MDVNTMDETYYPQYLNSNMAPLPQLVGCPSCGARNGNVETPRLCASCIMEPIRAERRNAGVLGRRF